MWGREKALPRPGVLGIGVMDMAVPVSIMHIHSGIHLLPTTRKVTLPSKQ